MQSVALLGAVFLAGCLSGCLSGSLDANSRPSVMPKLSELPGDAEKRNAILDRSGDRARPEHRRALTPKARKVETAAALVAALIGESFSTTKNVTLGVASDVDENRIFQKPARKTKREPTQSTSPNNVSKDKRDAGELVPWIKLDHARDETPSSSE